MLPMNDFEKPAASRHTLGAATLGRRIDLSLDLAIDGTQPSVNDRLADRPFASCSATMPNGAFLRRVLLAIASCRESGRREFPPRETAGVDAPEASASSLTHFPLFEPRRLLYPR